MENRDFENYLNELLLENAKEILDSLCTYASNRSKELYEKEESYSYEFTYIQELCLFRLLRNGKPILANYGDTERECILKTLKEMFFDRLDSISY